MSTTVSILVNIVDSFVQEHPKSQNFLTNSKPTADLTLYLIVSLVAISLVSLVTFSILVVKCLRNGNYEDSCGLCFSNKSQSRQYAEQYQPTLYLNTDGTLKYMEQAQPNTEWRFSQAQRPGTSGAAQPTEEAGVWPNNQFETERLQAMILASANEAAEGTSGLGGGTGTMGLSARYGPQFTLQHVPDYRQNVYIPGSTLTPTNAAGKRDGKSGKKKSGKKEKK
ncbi:protocadherin gamma-C5-like isoform 18-T18 [Discoglossus pictus]